MIHLKIEPADKAEDASHVLMRRLDASGAADIAWERDGEGGLKAYVPRIPDFANLESLLTRPGKFELRLLAETATSPGAISLARLDGSGSDLVEPVILVDENRLRNVTTGVVAGSSAYLDFHFDPRGAKNLAAATLEGLGRKLAIIVDDKIVVSPVIRQPVVAGTGRIEGGLTLENTLGLAAALRGGRLPAHVSIAAREPVAECPPKAP